MQARVRQYSFVLPIKLSLSLKGLHQQDFDAMAKHALTQSQVFLTSCLNDQNLGQRLNKWQQDNRNNILKNQMFSPEAQAEYESIVKDLAQCFIAFVGCKLIASKLPGSSFELQQSQEESSNLGKWCLWHVDPWYIELIVERLLSLKTDGTEAVDNVFNAFDLVDVKIPAQAMGDKGVDKAWTCMENIAQIRNQAAKPGFITLTALSSNQRNEDTAAEFSKLSEQELLQINAAVLIEFAKQYGIDELNNSQFELLDYDKRCFDTILELMRNEQALGLYDLARFACMTLVNYIPSSEWVEAKTAFRRSLGFSLQVLNIPRNSEAFIAQRYAAGSFKSYASRINEICKQQGNLVNQKDANDEELNWSKLEWVLNRLKDEQAQNEDSEADKYCFTEREFQVIERFIRSAQDSSEQYKECYHDLCFIDWDCKLERWFEATTRQKRTKLSNRIFARFNELDQQKASAEGQSHLEEPTLSEQEQQVAELADKRASKLEPEERQQLEAFFNAHRSELEGDKRLYRDLEKLLSIQDLSCTEFISGLYQMLISLSSAQCDLDRIILSLDGFASPEKFLQKHNTYMCSYFSMMYGPLLQEMMEQSDGRFVVKTGSYKDGPHPLMQFEEFYQVYDPQHKVTKDGSEYLQLKFKVTLEFGSEGSKFTNTGTLTWQMNKDSIGLKLSEDLDQICAEQAPLSSYFCQRLYISSGKLKGVDLNDLSTLLTDSVLSAGAFIAKPLEVLSDNDSVSASDNRAIKGPEERSLLKKFNAVCDKAQLSDELDDLDDFDPFGEADNSGDLENLKEQFAALAQQYVVAIEAFRNDRLTFDTSKALYQQYAWMLLSILKCDVEDSIRKDLMQIVQSIGIAYEYGSQAAVGDEFAIATPYNIQSMYQHLLHGERLCTLVKQMFAQRLFITKRQVLMNALAEMQRLPFGPEVIAANNFDDPEKEHVLQAVQGCYGYTLYQVVNSSLGRDASSAKESTVDFERKSLFINLDAKINTAIDIMERYVKEHPQLKERFNVVVYNCESVDLIMRLYSALAKDTFFASVNLYLYVINAKQATLSQHYQSFELLNQVNKNRLENQSESNRVYLMLMNEAEATKLKEQYGCNFGSMFDLGLMFHSSDLQAKFIFENYDLPVAYDEAELFHGGVDFASVSSETTSNLFLISPEQNLCNMVSLHALHYLVNGICNKETLAQLKQLLEQAAMHESELVEQDDASVSHAVPDTERVSVPVPTYQLVVTESNDTGLEIISLHRDCNLVVTFDNLLTKQQLNRLKIKLVEYRQPDQGNTSIFVSTKKESSIGNDFLKDLLIDLEIEPTEKLKQNIHARTLMLSGGLLMRSLEGAIYTNEMMGLVLSQALINQMISPLSDPAVLLQAVDQLEPKEQSAKLIQLRNLRKNLSSREVKYLADAYFMLDEYITWFGSKDSKRSDILCLNVCKQANGRYLLRIFMAESKFFQANIKAAATKSISQAQAAAQTFFDLFSHDNAICTVDRQLRLRQLLSMLSKNERFAKKMGKDEMVKFEQAVLSSHFDISLSVLSCVYAYADESSLEVPVIKTFNYGSTVNRIFKHNPVGVQVILGERATKAWSKGAFTKAVDVFNHLFMHDEEFLSFMLQQDIVAMDAAPDRELMRAHREQLAISAKENKDTQNETQSSSSEYKSEESTQSASEQPTEPAQPASDQGEEPEQPASDQGDDSALPASDQGEEPVQPAPIQNEEPEHPAQHASEQGDKPAQFDNSDSGNSKLELPPQPSLPKRIWNSAVELMKGKFPNKAAEVDRAENIVANFAENLNAEDKLTLQDFLAEHSHFAELLSNTPDSYKDELQKRKDWAKQQQQDLVEALKNLGFSPEPLDCHLTSNGAVFRFKGNDNFEAKKLRKVIESLLSTHAIKVDDVHSEPGVVVMGVTNVNASKITVPYLSICKRRQFSFDNPAAQDAESWGFNSKFLLGIKDDDSSLVYLDLRKDSPHTLVAGATGSGKSNVLNVMLLDMVLTNSSRDLCLILMDPKMGVELGVFKKLPQVKEIVCNKEEALNQLRGLVKEMELRFALFNQKAEEQQVHINKLDVYNKIAPTEQYLPHVVLVIDEFADWFTDRQFKQEANELINRLGAKARAAGIHLILATQRPDHNVVNDQLRNNLGNQIALKTKDTGNSKIILGDKYGAEFNASQLSGKGHMICILGEQSPFRAQAAFIDEDNIVRAIDAIHKDSN